MKTPRTAPAFALVEIVIAMGVVTFTLVAILGMLSVGMRSSRESTEDTLVANMATTVLNNLRATNQFTNFSDAASLQVPDIFFDAMGRWNISDAGVVGGSNSQSLYRCKVNFVTNDTPGGENLAMVNLEFTWPVQAAKPPNTNVIHATLAPY